MPRTKKLYLYVALCLLAGFGLWLFSETQKIRWVVELVGGTEKT